MLPLRDARLTLDAAIASVLAQTHADFELLVVDDGSSDGSPELLDRWARRDGRLRVLRREGRGDIVAALELGRAAARAPRLLRMDADDIAHPERLACALRVMERDARLAVVSCLVRSFPEARLRGGRRRYDAWLNGLRSHEAMFRERFVESPVAHPSVLLLSLIHI